MATTIIPQRLSPTTTTPAFYPVYHQSNLYDHEEHDDTGEYPLMPSEMSFVHIPRKFNEDENALIIVDDACSDTNVRFGRISQRFPWRYKTLKKVECIPFLFSFSCC